MSRLFYRKSQRITSDKEFVRVLSHRLAARRGDLCLYAASGEHPFPRFSVSISKSCGGAVERNRLKRLAREVFRLHQSGFKAGYDYILIISRKKPKKKTTALVKEQMRYNFKGMEQQVLELLEKLDKKNG